MAAIPYVPDELSDPAGIVAAIRERRGGQLLNLDRMLLHSPPFARGWNALLRATRTELSLPARLCELCICAVGILNGAEYEVQQHTGPLLVAGGTAAALQALRTLDLSALGNTSRESAAATREDDPFTPAERAALRLTHAMSRDIRVPAALLERVRELLGGERPLVELIGLIATYNMVSRFLIALRVDLE